MIILLVKTLYVVIVITHTLVWVYHADDILDVLGGQAELLCQVDDVVWMGTIDTTHQGRNGVAPLMLKVIIVYMVVNDVKDCIKIVVIITLTNQVIHQ